MIFICLCGIPGSGKSTIGKQLALSAGASFCECDEFFKNHKNEKTGVIIKLFHSRLTELLLSGNRVVCDGMYTSKASRVELLNGIEGVACKRCLIVMATPLEECLRRNANRERHIPACVIKDIYKKLEPPSIDEGWDEIIYYGGDDYETDFGSH